jgi:hypothetical protein
MLTGKGGKLTIGGVSVDVAAFAVKPGGSLLLPAAGAIQPAPAVFPMPAPEGAPEVKTWKAPPAKFEPLAITPEDFAGVAGMIGDIEAYQAKLLAALALPAEAFTVSTGMAGTTAGPFTMAGIKAAMAELERRRRANEAARRKAEWLAMMAAINRDRPFTARPRRLIGWFAGGRN